jgi:hypothetical protein
MNTTDILAPDGAVHALRNGQRQLDMDGVEIGVSRQALDEVLDAYDRLSSLAATDGAGPADWQWRSRIKGGAWDAWERGRFSQEVPPFMEVQERPLYAAPPAPEVKEAKSVEERSGFVASTPEEKFAALEKEIDVLREANGRQRGTIVSMREAIDGLNALNAHASQIIASKEKSLQFIRGEIKGQVAETNRVAKLLDERTAEIEKLSFALNGSEQETSLRKLALDRFSGSPALDILKRTAGQMAAELIKHGVDFEAATPWLAIQQFAENALDAIYESHDFDEVDE